METEGELVGYLFELTKRAYNVNPKGPVPLIPTDGAELPLFSLSDSEGEAEIHELEAEDDTEGPQHHAALLQSLE